MKKKRKINTTRKPLTKNRNVILWYPQVWVAPEYAKKLVLQKKQLKN